MQNNKFQQVIQSFNNNEVNNNLANNVNNAETVIKENSVYNISLDDIKNSYGILNNMSQKTTNLFEKAALETVNNLLGNILGIVK